MTKASIYLAGWLTTAVIAGVLFILFLSNTSQAGEGTAGTTTDPLQPGATQPLPEQSAVYLPNTVTPDAATDRSVSAVAGTETVYVYPDGSPAPAPGDVQSDPFAGIETGQYGRDDDDHDDYDDYDDDDERDEHAGKGGFLSGTLGKFLERHDKDD